MLNNKRVLAWIPARGGSKGIKNKNIKPLVNRPLIAYTIDAAKRSKYIDTVMVSTDSEKIATIARTLGAYIPGLRPAELAGDTAKTLDAVLYTLDLLKTLGETYDVFCLLQPTSPLRDETDIDGALELFEKFAGEFDIVSVSPVQKHPILIRSIDENGCLKKLLNVQSTVRRQDMPPFYEVNGAVYINAVSRIDSNTSFNDNQLPFVMCSDHSIDIDQLQDFVVAEYLLTKQ